jgi:hypothetical protein
MSDTPKPDTPNESVQKSDKSEYFDIQLTDDERRRLCVGPGQVRVLSLWDIFWPK